MDGPAGADDPLWALLRDDLLAWQLRSGRRYGLVFPNYKGEPWSETDWGNWTVRVWGPLREALAVSEPPYGLRHSYASLRIREGASIPELAEELGHSPQMTLGTYAHVIHELRGAPGLPAEQEISRARQEVAEQGLERLGGMQSDNPSRRAATVAGVSARRPCHAHPNRGVGPYQ